MPWLALLPSRALPAGIAALLLTTPAGAQWPPWTRSETDPVVFPEILVDRAAVPELRAVLLDSRDPAAFRRGHLPGALSAPPDSLLAAAGVDRGALTPGDPVLARDLPRALGALGLSGRETIVCYGERGKPAAPARLLWCLELAGHPDVRILNGGLAPNEPGLEAGSRQPSPASWEPPVRTDRAATPDWVLEHFGRPHPGLPDWEVLDLRGELAWRGGTIAAASLEESGHIPQSHPVDPADLFAADGRWLSPDSLRSFLTRLGPRPATTLRVEAELVAYGDGVTGDGALGYVAARIAGFPRVRWLPGGWLAWLAAGGPTTQVLASDEVSVLLESGSEHDAPVVILDVRHRSDWSTAHLPGAVQLAPHTFADSLDAILLRNFGDELDRSRTTLIAYCYGPGCIRSRNCTTLAAQAGFRHVVWFRGGIEEWIASGREVVRERVDGDSWWIPRPDEEARPESDSRAGSGRRERLPDSNGTVP